MIIPLHMERVLLSHPAIQEAVIYGIPPTHDSSLETKQTNGDLSRLQKIRAYVVKARDSNLTAQDVENFLAQQAPTMKGLSGGVVFLDSIPKTTVSLELLVRRDARMSTMVSNWRRRTTNPIRDWSSSIARLMYAM